MKVNLLCQLHALAILPLTEYAFHRKRKWRFDYAWPAIKLAVEVQGAVFAQGRHTRGAGYTEDCVKLCEAAILGWRVLYVTTGMVESGEALALIERALKGDV